MRPYGAYVSAKVFIDDTKGYYYTLNDKGTYVLLGKKKLKMLDR